MRARKATLSSSLRLTSKWKSKNSLRPLRCIADDAPIRAITRGPRFHWFGYYDKLQFDPGSRYALGCEGTIEHRLNNENDMLRIGMVDTKDNDRWIELGDTRAWSWHQTCMLQWLPGSKEEIIWNDRQDGQFVSHIMNVRTRKRRTLPSAIYAVSPDGTWAVVADSEGLRICGRRPGLQGWKIPIVKFWRRTLPGYGVSTWRRVRLT
jgi:hypothetical protein